MKQVSIVAIIFALIQFLAFNAVAGTGPPPPPPPPPPPEITTPAETTTPQEISPPEVNQPPPSVNNSSCAGVSLVSGECSQTIYGAYGNIATPVLDLFIDGVMDGTNTTSRFSGESQSAGDEMVSERFGFYMSGVGTNIDRKITAREVGYDSDLLGFVAGLDYRFFEEFIAGLSIGYTNSEANMDLGVGQVDLETVVVLLHGVYTPTYNITVNTYAGWSGLNFDSTRTIAGTGSAQSKTDGDQFVAGLSSSYNFNIGGFTILPQVSVDYLTSWINGFSEVGAGAANLNVGDQRINSLKTLAGVNLTYAWSQNWGVITPHIRVFYLHEFLNDNRVINTSPLIGTSTSSGFQTDNPDRDYVTLAAGISTQLPHSVQLYVDYQRTIAHSYIDSYIVSGGIRVGF